MAHAEKCPICYGKGKVLEEATKYEKVPTMNTCYGCGGKGWVEVQDNENAGIWPWPSIEGYGFKATVNGKAL